MGWTVDATSGGEERASSVELSLFKAAIEAIGDAVMVTSADLDAPGPVIEYVNPAFTTMTGYTPDEVIGRSPRLLQGPDTDRAVLTRMRVELGAGQTFHGEVVNYRKDGEPYLIEWLVMPIRDPSGQVMRWLSSQRDVTERRRLETRQSHLMAELQHRTGNLMATVTAIAQQTLATSSVSFETFSKRFTNRLGALSRAQGLLSQAEQQPVTLEVLIGSELRACGHDPDSIRIELDGPEIAVPGHVLQLLTLALHELVSNAGRDGALAAGAGRLAVHWHLAEPPPDESPTDAPEDIVAGRTRLVLDWLEQGVPMVRAEADEASRSYAHKLIERALPYTLGARTSYQHRNDEIRCRLDLPLRASRRHG